MFHKCCDVGRTARGCSSITLLHEEVFPCSLKQRSDPENALNLGILATFSVRTHQVVKLLISGIIMPYYFRRLDAALSVRSELASTPERTGVQRIIPKPAAYRVARTTQAGR